MMNSFPLLSRLRQETTAAHQELEDALDIPAVIRNPQEYQRMLAKFHGFHKGVEMAMENLTGWPEEDYDPAGRRKSPWLAEDLRAMGWSPAGIENLPLCRPADLPALMDTPSAMGCAYVMEGSTLGGRHISAMIRKESEIPEGAFRFFQSYGADTGAKWVSFLHSLAVFGARSSVEECDRAVKSARDTFQCFSLWMQRDLSPQK